MRVGLHAVAMLLLLLFVDRCLGTAYSKHLSLSYVAAAQSPLGLYAAVCYSAWLK